jgi:hypothetical protein
LQSTSSGSDAESDLGGESVDIHSQSTAKQAASCLPSGDGTAHINLDSSVGCSHSPPGDLKDKATDQSELRGKVKDEQSMLRLPPLELVRNDLLQASYSIQCMCAAILGSSTFLNVIVLNTIFRLTGEVRD